MVKVAKDIRFELQWLGSSCCTRARGLSRHSITLRLLNLFQQKLEISFLNSARNGNSTFLTYGRKTAFTEFKKSTPLSGGLDTNWQLLLFYDHIVPSASKTHLTLWPFVALITCCILTQTPKNWLTANCFDNLVYKFASLSMLVYVPFGKVQISSTMKY